MKQQRGLAAIAVWTVPFLFAFGEDRAEANSAPAAVIVAGSGTVADADTINSAIAASPQGAEIVIRGNCLITQTVRLLGNRSYRGESRTGTILKQADGANLPALVASSGFLDNTAYTGAPLSVRDLTLDGNKANNTRAQTDGLVLRAWLSVVENLQITRMGGNGLRLTNPSANGTRLKNTQVNGRIANNLIEESGLHGVFVDDPGNSVTDWMLADNWIAASGIDGIHLDNVAGWFVVRNHIYGVGRHAIYANRLYASSISDNYIEDFGSTNSVGTWCGICGIVNNGGGSTIAGNRIFNFSKRCNPASDFRYLSLEINHGTGTVVVTGNTMQGTGSARGYGIGEYFAAKGERKLTVVSTGNFIEGVQTHRMTDPHVTVSTGE